MRRKLTVVATIVASLVTTSIALMPAQGSAPTQAEVKKRLAACASLANGSTTSVRQTTRLSINLPREIYPTKILQITSLGATAGFISNGGPYGYGFGARGKPNCWSYYFEFNLTAANGSGIGEVNISSKSAVRGIPNYLIHIRVFGHSPTPPPTPAGIVRGQVLLGPICPVERIPPDPACAPKPYQTRIEIYHGASKIPYKSIATDSSGRFTLSLISGSYVLRATGGAVYPRCTDLSIRVIAGRTVKVIVNCDTGIR